MSAPTDRPAPPPPLKPGDEESMAAWRAYMVACAKADWYLRATRPGASLNERLN
ncbi:MAG: hypothetical protein AAGI70_02105 [Pseudomonadota bacterium]